MRARRRPTDLANRPHPVNPRRGNDFHARHQSILDAAELVFGKKGYADTSMAEIARISELGVGHLYRFFVDKGDLFLAVLERKFEALCGALKAALSTDGSSRTRLTAMIGVHLAFFEANRTFFNLFQAQARNSPCTLQTDFKTRIIPKFLLVREEVRKVISEGILQGEIKNIDPEHLTSGLLGILQGLVGQWMYTNSGSSLSSLADIAARLFFEGAAAKVLPKQAEL